MCIHVQYMYWCIGADLASAVGANAPKGKGSVGANALKGKGSVGANAPKRKTDVFIIYHVYFLKFNLNCTVD